VNGRERKIENFKDLRIWQEGISLVEEVYLITKEFPREEIYGLISQTRRAAVSIPSNVAEGFMRNSNKEFRKYLFVSLASSAELETQLIISNRLKYISKEALAGITGKLGKFNRMTMTLIKKL